MKREARAGRSQTPESLGLQYPEFGVVSSLPPAVAFIIEANKCASPPKLKTHEFVDEVQIGNEFGQIFRVRDVDTPEILTLLELVCLLEVSGVT